VRKRRVFGRVTAVVYAAAVAAVVVAPAVVLLLAADGGGITSTLQGFDLVLVSSLVGLPYAVLAHRRVRRQSTAARSRIDVWIAALHALVVLALMASLLLALVLLLLAPHQEPIADLELPLILVWAGVQLVAVGLAEVTDRAVFRWLARPPSRSVSS
jgi:hypothetical protein